MSLLPLDPQSIAAIILCITALAVIHKHAQRPSDLPPGPRGHWLFGNVLPNSLCVALRPLKQAPESALQRVPQIRGMDQGIRTSVLAAAGNEDHHRSRPRAGRDGYHGEGGRFPR